MIRTYMAVAACALALAGPVHAAGDAAAGKTKALVCSACHGIDGNSINPLWAEPRRPARGLPCETDEGVPFG